SRRARHRAMLHKWCPILRSALERCQPSAAIGKSQKFAIPADQPAIAAHCNALDRMLRYRVRRRKGHDINVWTRVNYSKSHGHPMLLLGIWVQESERYRLLIDGAIWRMLGSGQDVLGGYPVFAPVHVN